jgi:hypothetical protein
MSASFTPNSGFGFSSSLSTSCSVDQDAEQCLNYLADFTESLSCALEQPLDESTIANAEKAAGDLHRWVLLDANSDQKKKIEVGVSAVLRSICNLKPEKVSQDNLSMVARVLDVGDSLLQCHKMIMNQMVQTSEE